MDSFQFQCLYSAEQGTRNGKYQVVMADGIPLPHPVDEDKSTYQVDLFTSGLLLKSAKKKQNIFHVKTLYDFCLQILAQF